MIAFDNELQTPKLQFSSSSIYLITGGLGGIGLKICEWMLEKGARNIILIRRRRIIIIND